jgi:hypothetical protein
MGFLNHNKIFDIDILNLETGCNKIRDDFDHMGSWVHWNGGQFEVDVGLFYLIDAVRFKNPIYTAWTFFYVVINILLKPINSP